MNKQQHKQQQQWQYQKRQQQVGPTTESNSNCKYIWGPKIFWVKKCWVQEIFGPKKVFVQKNLSSEKFGLKKVGSKNFGSKKMLGPNMVVRHFLFCPTQFGSKNIEFTKILGQVKFSSKKSLVSKKFLTWPV